MQARMRYEALVEYAPPGEADGRSCQTAIKNLSETESTSLWIEHAGESRLLRLGPNAGGVYTVIDDIASTSTLLLCRAGLGSRGGDELEIAGLAFPDPRGLEIDSISLEPVSDPAFDSWRDWDLSKMPAAPSILDPPFDLKSFPPETHPLSRAPTVQTAIPRRQSGPALQVHIGRELFTYNAFSPPLSVEAGERLLLRFEVNLEKTEGWYVYARLEFRDSAGDPLSSWIWLNQEPLTGPIYGWRPFFADIEVPKDAAQAVVILSHLPATDFHHRASDNRILWSLPERYVEE